MSIRERVWPKRNGTSGKAWIVDYTDQHGRRHVKTCKTERAAQLFHRSINSKPADLTSARHIVRKLVDQLAWRGPTGKWQGHVVLLREDAQALLAIIPSKLMPDEIAGSP